jgi:hypothetical protein
VLRLCWDLQHSPAGAREEAARPQGWQYREAQTRRDRSRQYRLHNPDRGGHDDPGRSYRRADRLGDRRPRTTGAHGAKHSGVESSRAKRLRARRRWERVFRSCGRTRSRPRCASSVVGPYRELSCNDREAIMAKKAKKAKSKTKKGKKAKKAAPAKKKKKVVAKKSAKKSAKKAAKKAKPRKSAPKKAAAPKPAPAPAPKPVAAPAPKPAPAPRPAAPPPPPRPAAPPPPPRPVAAPAPAPAHPSPSMGTPHPSGGGGGHSDGGSSS